MKRPGNNYVGTGALARPGRTQPGSGSATVPEMHQ